MREKLNDSQKLLDILMDELPDKHPWEGEVRKLRDRLIANGVIIKSDCEDCASNTTRIIDKLYGEIAKQRWIPVTERLPEKMEKYLCRYVFGENTEYPFEQVLYYYTAVEKPHFQNEGSLGLRVTHWMPLPEAPKGE